MVRRLGMLFDIVTTGFIPEKDPHDGNIRSFVS
jgi:hypothetical protein